MRQGEDASRTKGIENPLWKRGKKIHTHKHTHAHTHIYILELAYRMRDHPKDPETIRVVHRRGERKP